MTPPNAGETFTSSSFMKSRVIERQSRLAMWLFKNPWKMTRGWIPIEQAVLKTITEALVSRSAASALQSQLSHLLEAYRYKLDSGYRGRFVYDIKCGRFPSMERRELAIVSGETSDARFDFRVIADGGVVAEIYVTGCQVHDPHSLVIDRFVICELNSFLDQPVIALHGWVREFADRGILSDFAAPLESEILCQRIRDLGGVPDEFHDLNKQINGARMRSYVVKGINELEAVQLGKGKFISLIDMQDEGQIGILCGRDDLWHFNANDDGIALRHSFKTVLQKLWDGALFEAK